MSKELEALENIKHYDSRVGLHESDYDIIEKALEKYDYLIRNLDIFPRDAKVGKKLKALELLKEYSRIKIHIDEEEKVAFLYTTIIKDFETKETAHIILGYIQNKEEYELLKEVLK